MTAQKFLTDINAALERLEEGIADIKQHLEVKSLGELQACINTLLSMARAVPRHEFGSEELQGFAQDIKHASHSGRAIMTEYQLRLEKSLPPVPVNVREEAIRI